MYSTGHTLHNVLFVTLITLYEYRQILESKTLWLNDNIINAAQRLLKKQYGIPGLQNTLLGHTCTFDVVGGLEFVQVLHSNNSHWLTISTIGCSYSTVKVYDSLYMKMPRSTIKQVCSLLASSEPSITLQFEPSDRQLNGNDCGLFALAFCTALCAGKDPQGLRFDQKTMRQHLLKCLTQGHMEPFPCKGIIQTAVAKTYQIPIYCTCRTQEAGNMVECERCREWYHQECVSVPEHVWKKGSIPWVCRYCS